MHNLTFKKVQTTNYAIIMMTAKIKKIYSLKSSHDHKIITSLLTTCRTLTNHSWKPPIMETHNHFIETHYHLWKPFLKKEGMFE
jgi:hypothetical protein